VELSQTDQEEKEESRVEMIEEVMTGVVVMIEEVVVTDVVAVPEQEEIVEDNNF
jgi:hypothetical protein